MCTNMSLIEYTYWDSKQHLQQSNTDKTNNITIKGQSFHYTLYYQFSFSPGSIYTNFQNTESPTSQRMLLQYSLLDHAFFPP